MSSNYYCAVCREFTGESHVSHSSGYYHKVLAATDTGSQFFYKDSLDLDATPECISLAGFRQHKAEQDSLRRKRQASRRKLEKAKKQCVAVNRTAQVSALPLNPHHGGLTEPVTVCEDALHEMSDMQRFVPPLMLQSLPSTQDSLFTDSLSSLSTHSSFIDIPTGLRYVNFVNDFLINSARVDESAELIESVVQSATTVTFSTGCSDLTPFASVHINFAKVLTSAVWKLILIDLPGSTGPDPIYCRLCHRPVDFDLLLRVPDIPAGPQLFCASCLLLLRSQPRDRCYFKEIVSTEVRDSF